MSRFRGSDEALEREVAALQRLVRVRLERSSADLRELETALGELRRELRRRRAPSGASADGSVSPTAVG